ncbi:MAG: class I SAM-dependent methyltransferase [Myxococcota bacterium]
MPERRLPIYVRWTVVAEGAVTRARTARSMCAVNGWLVSHRPSLLPHDPDPDRIAAIRARIDLVDGLLLQIRDQAIRRGESLAVWHLGAGMDGRWARMAGPLSPAVVQWVEVEEPRVVGAKRRVLEGSPFAEHWHRVETVPLVPAAWMAEGRDGSRVVALVSGALHRLSASEVLEMLERIRVSAPGASVILDLTGAQGRARTEWSTRRLEALGWRTVDDLELAFRNALTGRSGDELCSGMVPIRLIHLENLA